MKSAGLAVFHRVGHRILGLVALGFAVTVIAVGQFYAAREEQTLRELSARDAERLLQSVVRSLESIMLPGQAVLAQSFAERLKGIPEVLEFRILRTDGTEAFLDNATLREVNARIGREAFPLRPREERSAVLAPADPHLRRALDHPVSRNLVSYETRAGDGSRIANYVYAIPAQATCTGCHGAQKSHLGAFKLSLSMAAPDARIAATQRDIWIVTAIALAAVLLVVGVLIHRSVVRPIEMVRAAMERAAGGDLRQSVPVPGRDEVGKMAESFNAMLERLHEVHSGLREEQDKLNTVIESTGEGVVVTNRAGLIVLVNEAAERLLRKRRERIIEEGFPRLLDAPQIVADLLARQSNPPVPYKVSYKGSTLCVTAATIHSKNGDRLGSAALFRDITPAEQTADGSQRERTVAGY